MSEYKEGDLVYTRRESRRTNLYDIKVFKEPNTLKRVATYNARTNKITFDDADICPYILPNISSFAKAKKYGEIVDNLKALSKEMNK